MLRRFGPKRDEMVGGWRKLHNEELLIRYDENDQIMEDEVDSEYRKHRVKRNEYKILVGKPEGSNH
jgi:hypothetical protein